jgi:drug/metabolite transporter (DMT)-like permease
MNVKKINIPTLMGIGSILLWSTTIAFMRSIAETNGSLNTAMFNLLFSSIFLFVVQFLVYKKNLFSKIKSLPLSYFYKVGIFMTIHMSLLYTAVGNAKSREAVVVVGIINYLWPGLTFLFSVPILKNKAKYSLLFSGIIIAFTGTVVAFLEGNRLSLARLSSSIKSDMLPFLFALGGAAAWGIYSNMTRKYTIKEDTTATPVIFLITAVFLTGIQLAKGEIPSLHLPGKEYWELTYLVIFPTSAAYFFWDRAMKKGNKNLVAALSYGIPPLSTLISCLYLDVRIGFGMAAAALLVVIGAVLCRYSIR